MQKLRLFVCHAAVTNATVFTGFWKTKQWTYCKISIISWRVSQIINFCSYKCWKKCFLLSIALKFFVSRTRHRLWTRKHSTKCYIAFQGRNHMQMSHPNSLANAWVMIAQQCCLKLCWHTIFETEERSSRFNMIAVALLVFPSLLIIMVRFAVCRGIDVRDRDSCLVE